MRRKIHKHLKKSFTQKKDRALKKLTSKHQVVRQAMSDIKEKVPEVEKAAVRTMGAGALAGALILAPVGSPTKAKKEAEVLSSQKSANETSADSIISKSSLVYLLGQGLPAKVHDLDSKQALYIEQIVKDVLNIRANVELDGYRLNTAYGYIGAEQHLPRYPGDTAAAHGQKQSSGITSRTGAWGYFAKSKSALTKEQIEKEKYYFAVQTFKAPSWSENVYQTKDWFKYRKMIAINPKTGDAVVGVVADAGPAEWTGKQYGGSPEIMEALHLNRGKGDVLLLFVDDQGNQVPLGPVE